MPLELIISSNELSIRPSTFQSRFDTESTPNPENLSKEEKPTNPIQNQSSRSIKRTHSLTQPTPSFGSNERKKEKQKWTLTTNLRHRTTSFRGRIQQCSCNRTGLINNDDDNNKKKALSPLLLLYTRIDSAPGNNFRGAQLQMRNPIQLPTPNLLHAPALTYILQCSQQQGRSVQVA